MLVTSLRRRSAGKISTSALTVATSFPWAMSGKTRLRRSRPGLGRSKMRLTASLGAANGGLLSNDSTLGFPSARTNNHSAEGSDCFTRAKRSKSLRTLRTLACEKFTHLNDSPPPRDGHRLPGWVIASLLPCIAIGYEIKASTPLGDASHIRGSSRTRV